MGCFVTGLSALLAGLTGYAGPTPTYRALMQDVLVAADYWDDEPMILAAGLGVCDILGTPGLSIPGAQEQAVFRNGGAWNIVETDIPPRLVPLRAYTSCVPPTAIALAYGYPVVHGDGIPVVFSWPVLPSTAGAADFLITLNTGRRVRPQVASIMPNFEYNERTTVVLIGEFGNRFPPTDPRAVYPVFVEIVEDSTPLMLAGPGGRIESAVGLTHGDGAEPLTAYRSRGGPTLCAAKLTVMSEAGEGGPDFLRGLFANDGVSLYGDDAQYRLRVVSNGGFSPDGVRGVLPDEFSRYFRLRVQVGLDADDELWITQAGVPYEVGDFGTIEVVGLADLGVAQESYDDAYMEDHDNQIDIVLKGDEAAMRRITHVDIPADGDYSPFYNPGGPGNDPYRGVRYSEPGAPDLEPVTIAIDDPMQVTYRGR